MDLPTTVSVFTAVASTLLSAFSWCTTLKQDQKSSVIELKKTLSDTTNTTLQILGDVRTQLNEIQTLLATNDEANIKAVRSKLKEISKEAFWTDKHHAVGYCSKLKIAAQAFEDGAQAFPEFRLYNEILQSFFQHEGYTGQLVATSLRQLSHLPENSSTDEIRNALSIVIDEIEKAADEFSKLSIAMCEVQAV